MPEDRSRLPSAYDRARSREVGPAPQQEAPVSARIRTLIFDALGGNSPDMEKRRRAMRAADLLTGAGAELAVGMTPVIGDAQAMYEAKQAYDQGDMGRAIMLGGLGAVGMVPVVGDIAKKGGELAMDTASRMARAADQGFDVSRPVYHGTAADILSFNPSGFGGSSTKARSAKMGVWLSDSPEVAEGYARFAAEDAPVSRLLDQANAAERAGDWDKYQLLTEQAEALDLGGSLRNAGGQNVIPANIRGNLLEIDADGATMADLDDSQLYEWAMNAKAKGFDGLKILNFSDNADFGKYLPATHYLIFDPSNIRSVNAAFDPAKRNSANLLAGGAAATVGAGALINARQDDQGSRQQ